MRLTGRSKAGEKVRGSGARRYGENPPRGSKENTVSCRCGRYPQRREGKSFPFAQQSMHPGGEICPGGRRKKEEYSNKRRHTEMSKVLRSSVQEARGVEVEAIRGSQKGERTTYIRRAALLERQWNFVTETFLLRAITPIFGCRKLMFNLRYINIYIFTVAGYCMLPCGLMITAHCETMSTNTSTRRYHINLSRQSLCCGDTLSQW